MLYQLMNKDVVVAEFEESTAYGEYVYEQVGLVLAALPFGCTDINEWIDGRRIAKHRRAIQKLLHELGMTDRHSFIGMARCLSLSDSFWMKPANEELTWDEVSLFSNPFDYVIAHIAFDGAGMFGRENSPTSPEFATSGSYAKCWIRDPNGDIFMLKRGSTGAANAGFEPYSEKFASDLLDAAGVEHVPYSLMNYHGTLASSCPLFTSEDEGFVPAYRAMNGRIGISEILSFAGSFGDEARAREMLVMDAIMWNSDRHTGNFGFLVNNDSGELTGFAPLFDHNLACLPSMMEMDSLDEFLAGAPGPKLGGTFEGVARELLTSDLRATLISLRDFDYENPGFDCPQWRVDMLNELKERQIDMILGQTRIPLSNGGTR